MDLSGGHRGHRGRTAAVVAALAAIALLLAACGGSDDDDAGGEASGTYEVAVVERSFPAEQSLGEETELRLGVRNEGDETVPALIVNVTVGGEAGRNSAIPFAVREAEPGLAEPDRPVWVLAEHYPKRVGEREPGGADTSSAKAYSFGPLKPGETTEMVWRLTATRTGEFDVVYRVDAGLGGEAKAETPAGGAPRGRFSVSITDEVPDMTVDDRGRVVEIEEGDGERGGRKADKGSSAGG